MVTRPHAWHAAAVTYGLVAVSLNLPAIWIHVVNAQRGTFELFVMLALATTEIRRYGPRLQSLCFGFWVLSGVYVFLLGYNAGYIRDVLTFI